VVKLVREILNHEKGVGVDAELGEGECETMWKDWVSAAQPDHNLVTMFKLPAEFLKQSNEFLHRYAVGKELGAGAFATVYECTTIPGRKRFAVKVPQLLTPSHHHTH
jgi:hypothetical protein